MFRNTTDRNMIEIETEIEVGLENVDLIYATKVESVKAAIAISENGCPECGGKKWITYAEGSPCSELFNDLLHIDDSHGFLCGDQDECLNCGLVLS